MLTCLHMRFRYLQHKIINTINQVQYSILIVFGVVGVADLDFGECSLLSIAKYVSVQIHHGASS